MRPIDCHKAKKAIHEHGTNMLRKDTVLKILDSIPTLTPQNETTPCYQPDGDGCAYQCYDGQDEPIEKCKECPLCYSDKQRHHTPQNEPLTIEQLREMDGEPVYIVAKRFGISEWNIPNGIGEIVLAYDEPCLGVKAVVPAIRFTNGREFRIDRYGIDWLAYRRPPEGQEAMGGKEST